MAPIQIIIVLFALFAIARAFRAFRADLLDRRKLILWSLFWVAVVTIIALPQTTEVAARALGVGRGVDVVLYLSVVILVYAVFQQSRRIDRTERAITTLVRSVALKSETDKSKHASE